MLIILFLLVAFLLGAVPFSFIIGKRVKGLDLRKVGSGNLGATNVFRTLGPRWGVTCLLLDMAKGAAAVALMTALVRTWPPGEPTPFHITPDLFRIVAGGVAALGHTFSPWVSFHGGKGVATTGGAFFVLEPYAVLVALATFAIVFAVSRIVSLGSIAAAVILPLAVLFFERRNHNSKTIIWFTFLVCAFVIWKHRANLARLRAGTETRLRHHKGDHKDSHKDSQAAPGGRSGH